MQEYIIELSSDDKNALSIIAKAYNLHELIRCKNCKHGLHLDDTNYIVCGRPFASNRETHTEKWFCADGKRKDDADE